MERKAWKYITVESYELGDWSTEGYDFAAELPGGMRFIAVDGCRADQFKVLDELSLYELVR